MNSEKKCLDKRSLLNQSLDCGQKEIAELFLSLKTMQISKTGNILKESCKMQIFIGRQTIVILSFLSRKKWALRLYTVSVKFTVLNQSQFFPRHESIT